MRGPLTIAVALVASATLVSVSAAGGGTSTNLACANQVVATWPLARVANETISVSVEADHVGAMGPAARAGYGALVIFGTTAPSSFSAVLATLQRERPVGDPMLVMSDEEGGGVERLTNLVATIPWAQTMGRNLPAARVTAEGERIGRSMIAAGLNTDLAPVLDVDGRAVEPGAADPDGYRSFSGDPTIAARDGVAFAAGLRASGVTAVVKHFPGLGGATGNTDDGPAATEPWATLRQSALVPFAAAFASGVGALMMSNARVPGLSRLPASLSPALYRYVRQTMGFGGLIMTDSLGSGAIGALHLSVPQASVEALEAGDDLVLGGSATSPTFDLHAALSTSLAIQRAVAAGDLSRASLDAAAAEVLAARTTVSCPVATTTTTSASEP